MNKYLAWATHLLLGAGARGQPTTTASATVGNDEFPSLVSDTLRELLAALDFLNGRLRDYSAPFEQDEYDRVSVLLFSMIDSAEKLCRAAARAERSTGPEAHQQPSAALRYTQLAEALVQTRRQVTLVLRPLRPRIDEHAEAIALIARLSAASARPPES